jgi:hypothetical protein
MRLSDCCKLDFHAVQVKESSKLGLLFVAFLLAYMLQNPLTATATNKTRSRCLAPGTWHLTICVLLASLNLLMLFA